MKSVLVIGESCVDKFVYCKTERLSPEAPVPVLVPIEIKTNDGMSGNVRKNLESLLNPEIKVMLLTQEDEITKTRFIDKKSNHLFLRLDEGENEISQLELKTKTLEIIKGSDIVIVSDYNKGFLSDEILQSIGENSKLSILDSKRKLSRDIVEKFTFVKLNENEAKLNTELSECDNLIVTLGEKGASFRNEIFPSPNPQETIDVSGAGDTFTASFIIKFYETNDIAKSISFGNEMSSIVVSKRGVVTPY